MKEKLRITNAHVFREGKFWTEDLLVEGDRIVAAFEASAELVGTKTNSSAAQSQGERVVASVAEPGVTVLDAGGLYIIPGLTDIHFHGAMGKDLCDGEVESIRAIQAYEASVGVTQICPATMTLSAEQLRRIFAVVKTAQEAEPRAGTAWFCGVHMEGPYISAQKLGAQNPQYVAAPSWEQYESYQELAGSMIRIVSLAPEAEGALSFIEQAQKSGVVVSLAHSTASYDCAREAYQRGASQATHLFNAMPGLHHRDPGIIGAAYDSAGVNVELICDGVHVHPTVIRMVFELFKGRVCLISDSMCATGLQDGSYELGGQKVLVQDKVARIASNGAIAGSVTNLLDCLRFAVACGVPWEEAIYAASELPAHIIGIDQEAGVIRPGNKANFLLVDEQLGLKAVYIAGARLGEAD